MWPLICTGSVNESEGLQHRFYFVSFACVWQSYVLVCEYCVITDESPGMLYCTAPWILMVMSLKQLQEWGSVDVPFVVMLASPQTNSLEHLYVGSCVFLGQGFISGCCI